MLNMLSMVLHQRPDTINGCIVIQLNIFCIGGFDSGRYLNDVIRRQWKEIAPMHYELSHLAVPNCRIYFVELMAAYVIA